MLPKITSALTQLIRPIAASSEQRGLSVDQRPDPSGFQRFKKKKEQSSQEKPKEKSGEKPQAQVIPFPSEGRTEAPPESQAQLKNAAPSPPGTPSVTHAFINLLSSLQNTQGIIMKWVGSKAYQKSVGQSKKSAKFRTGAMLDNRVE